MGKVGSPLPGNGKGRPIPGKFKPETESWAPIEAAKEAEADLSSLEAAAPAAAPPGNPKDVTPGNPWNP